MSWDEIYRRLEEELGHEPDSGEVQNRILEMLDGQFKDREGCFKLELFSIPVIEIPFQNSPYANPVETHK